MKPPARIVDTKGVSLIEVMAAVAIFLIVALGFTLGILSAFKNNRTTRNVTVAMNLAQAKIEEIRMLGAPALVNGNDSVNASGLPGSTFTRTWTVTTSYDALSGLFRLNVTVSWLGGDANQVTLFTLVRT